MLLVSMVVYLLRLGWCLSTTNQPDTPPTFKSSNTRFSHNSCKSGTVEVDESYFGARRVKGKRGRGTGGKTPVFGMHERGSFVYTKVVSDCSKGHAASHY
jgi:hypothetical protein